MTSQPDPVHSDGLAPPSIPPSVILDNPELTRADLAVLAAILELGEGAYRDDIAERVGVVVTRVSEAVGKLTKLGLIEVKREWVKGTLKQSKNFYSSSLSKSSNGDIDESSKSSNGDIDTPSESPNGDIDESSKSSNGDIALGRKRKKGSKSPNDDSMNHELMNHDSEILEKMTFFDFLRGPNRRRCAERCSLEDAKKWREVKDFYDQHELWEKSTGVDAKGGIGWIVRRIKEDYPPPPIQIPLPEASLDLSEPLLMTLPAQMSDEEILWAEVQGVLRPQMTRGTFDTVIQGTTYLGRENGHHLVGVPGERAKDWLENRLRDTVQRAFKVVLKADAEIKFELLPEPSEDSV